MFRTSCQKKMSNNQDKIICKIINNQIVVLQSFIQELSQKTSLKNYEKKDLEDALETFFAMNRVFEYFGGKTI